MIQQCTIMVSDHQSTEMSTHLHKYLPSAYIHEHPHTHRSTHHIHINTSKPCIHISQTSTHFQKHLHTYTNIYTLTQTSTNLHKHLHTYTNISHLYFMHQHTYTNSYTLRHTSTHLHKHLTSSWSQSFHDSNLGYGCLKLFIRHNSVEFSNTSKLPTA